MYKLTRKSLSTLFEMGWSLNKYPDDTIDWLMELIDISAWL